MQETQETWVWSLGQEDTLQKGMATFSSILAWRTAWIEEPGGLQSMGLQRIWRDWRDLAHTCTVWNWEMGWEKLAGCPPWRDRVTLDQDLGGEGALCVLGCTCLECSVHHVELRVKSEEVGHGSNTTDFHCSYWVSVDLLKYFFHLFYLFIYVIDFIYVLKTIYRNLKNPLMLVLLGSGSLDRLTWPF